MTNEEQALLMMKGLLSQIHGEERQHIDDYILSLKGILEDGGDAAQLAFQYIMIEMAAEESKK